MDERIEGVVKWFSSERGYGFISPDRGGKDIFIHHSAINMKGYKTLNEGDKVTFSVISGTKGPQCDALLVVE